MTKLVVSRTTDFATAVSPASTIDEDYTGYHNTASVILLFPE